MKFSVENLIAAPFTPMNQDESINLEAIPAYGQCLINQGRGRNFWLSSFYMQHTVCSQDLSFDRIEVSQKCTFWELLARECLFLLMNG